MRGTPPNNRMHLTGYNGLRPLPPADNVRGDVSRLLVGGAAKWSLISNAVQHERVMAVCRKEVTSRSTDVKMVLQEVIASAEKDMKERKTR